ncbi:hypothetical protein ACFFF5_10950 [Lederbergia wuyishanensis]|uniref:Uncharacterized protein n=1 Tax=Lederbergia wuyishanensis TaxID=1347903 RepID=A0ABU0D4D1_9BACI|nr:hypothetical protein [Lederbergia wuyishanensis]MCJ8008145.1 hypothetical protein [Lederbergia wuyishanensis]MDQ0343267.1 hypothetical protein [Lederbergia wuyishanensis]
MEKLNTVVTKEIFLMGFLLMLDDIHLKAIELLLDGNKSITSIAELTKHLGSIMKKHANPYSGYALDC